MTSLVDSFLVWWLQAGRYKWSRLRRYLCERRYLNVALPSANSLEEIEDRLRQVAWTMDGPLHLFDSISYPQATWVKKKDDCDGFAVLAAELLNRLSRHHNPVLITAMVRPIRASHTVCAFSSQQGFVWFFDNCLLRYEGLKTYDDVVAKITHSAQRLVCWDVRNPRTLELIEFHTL